MKMAFLADLHIANHRSHGGPVTAGINQRCRATLDALASAVRRANDLRCDALYLLGDVFDTTRPEPQVVAEVQRILHEFNEEVVLVEGNHDMVSMTPGDHSLGPLSPHCTVIDRPAQWCVDGVQVFAVPFEPGPAHEWLPRRVQELSVEAATNGATRRILVTHVGISDHDTPAFMKATHDQIPAHELGTICATHGIHLVAAGNWHFHRVFNLATPGFASAVQVGTLCPTGWDNPGLEGHGTMPVWDSTSGKLTVEHIPGPRFLNLSAELAATGSIPPAPDCSLYVRVKAEQSQLALCQAQLQHRLEQGLLRGFEVELQDVEVQAAARTAATVARSAETLEAALAGFVEQMPLPDGVDRAAVLAQARRFLSAS